MKKTTTTSIIYYIRCKENGKIYIASSAYTDCYLAYVAYFNSVMKEDIDETSYDLSQDMKKYGKEGFTVGIIKDNVLNEEVRDIKMEYVHYIAGKYGTDRLYNDIDTGNRKKPNPGRYYDSEEANKISGTNETTKIFYGIVSKKFIAITIFDDRARSIFKALANPKSKYFDRDHELSAINRFNTFDEAAHWISVNLKELTNNLYSEKAIKRECVTHRVGEVKHLKAIGSNLVVGYYISDQEYSDMLQEQRRIKTEKSMREILEILNSNRL